MGARERSNFELTLKGTEELAARTYRLDARARNILFLIQRGYLTVEGILENSIFPRDDVVERLRELLRGTSSRSRPLTTGPARSAGGPGRDGWAGDGWVHRDRSARTRARPRDRATGPACLLRALSR